MKELTLTQLSQSILSGQLTSREAVEYSLQRIESTNSKLNSFITVNDKALEAALQSDRRVKENKALGPLEGIPIGVKDLFCTKNILTTAGSKMLSNFVPPYTATAIERLERAGAIIVGKNNLDEFAMGSSNETSHFGPCRNPWDLERVAGGSSGGSASAVAASQVTASIGTDTGGSVRQPAAFCNLVGAKPTYGRISRWGMIAYASSMDQAGTLTKTVADAALLLEVMCGKDTKDSTSSDKEVPAFSKLMNKNISGKTFACIKQFSDVELHPEIESSFLELKKAISKAGAKIVEIEIPNIELSVPMYYLIATSEASSNLARYDGVRFGHRADFSKDLPEGIDDFYSRNRQEGFGVEVKRRILLGTFSLSSGYYDEYYTKACQVRRLLQGGFLSAFKSCDAIISPVTTQPAFKVGEKIDDPIAMYYNDTFTTAANLAGLPAMSVPLGFTKSGLPFGMQVMANHFCETEMLSLGAWVESEFKAHERLTNVI